VPDILTAGYAGVRGKGETHEIEMLRSEQCVGRHDARAGSRAVQQRGAGAVGEDGVGHGRSRVVVEVIAGRGHFDGDKRRQVIGERAQVVMRLLESHHGGGAPVSPTWTC
jgi:hypothetical protein